MTTITVASKEAVPVLLNPINNPLVMDKPIEVYQPDLKVKFIHLRYHDFEGADSEENMYFAGEVQAKGGITAAYTVVDKPDADCKTIKVAVARCCQKDNFNKTLARQKASGRLWAKSVENQRFVETFALSRDMTNEQIRNEIIHRLVAKYDLPFNLF